MVFHLRTINEQIAIYKIKNKNRFEPNPYTAEYKIMINKHVVYIC